MPDTSNTTERHAVHDGPSPTHPSTPVSGDQLEEVGAFRRQFDADGFSAEIRREVAAQVQQRLQAEHSLIERHLHAKDAAIDALRQAQEQVRQFQESQWNQPRMAFAIVTAVAAVVFGGNLYSQYMATTALNERATDLRGITSRADEQIRQAGDQLQSSIARHDAWIGEYRKEFKEFGTQLALLKAEYETSSATLRRQREIDVQVQAKVHQTLSYLAIARDHLTYRFDPARAWDYARLGAEELRAAKGLFADRDEGNRVLDALQAPLLMVQAEAAWQLKRYDDVERLARQLITLLPDNAEAAGYLGKLELRQAILQMKDEAAFKDRLDRAILRLTTHLSGERDSSLMSEGELYLAMACLAAGRHRQAQQLAETMVRKSPDDAARRQRMNPYDQTVLVLAENLQSLSGFLQSGAVTLDNRESPCQYAPTGVMDVVPAELFEGLLEAVIARRNLLTRDPNVAEALGVRAAQLIAYLRLSCRDGGCVNCSSGPGSNGTVPQDLRKRYGLPAMGLPPITTNTALARANEQGELVLQAMRMVQEQRTAVRMEGDRQVEFAYTVEVPVIVERTFPNVEAVLPDRYVPFVGDWYAVEGVYRNGPNRWIVPIPDSIDAAPAPPAFAPAPPADAPAPPST